MCDDLFETYIIYRWRGYGSTSYPSQEPTIVLSNLYLPGIKLLALTKVKLCQLISRKADRELYSEGRSTLLKQALAAGMYICQALTLLLMCYRSVIMCSMIFFLNVERYRYFYVVISTNNYM